MGLNEELNAQSEAVRGRVHELSRQVVAKVQPQLFAFLSGVLKPEVVELYDAKLLAHLPLKINDIPVDSNHNNSLPHSLSPHPTPPPPLITIPLPHLFLSPVFHLTLFVDQ